MTSSDRVEIKDDGSIVFKLMTDEELAEQEGISVDQLHEEEALELRCMTVVFEAARRYHEQFRLSGKDRVGRFTWGFGRFAEVATVRLKVSGLGPDYVLQLPTWTALNAPVALDAAVAEMCRLAAEGSDRTPTPQAEDAFGQKALALALSASGAGWDVTLVPAAFDSSEGSPPDEPTHEVPETIVLGMRADATFEVTWIQDSAGRWLEGANGRLGDAKRHYQYDVDPAYLNTVIWYPIELLAGLFTGWYSHHPRPRFPLCGQLPQR